MDLQRQGSYRIAIYLFTPKCTSPTPALGVGRTLVREKDDMEMVYVPGGIFEMGSADGDDHEARSGAALLRRLLDQGRVSVPDRGIIEGVDVGHVGVAGHRDGMSVSVVPGLAVLRELDCDQALGFLFSEPREASAFDHALDQN